MSVFAIAASLVGASTQGAGTKPSGSPALQMQGYAVENPNRRVMDRFSAVKHVPKYSRALLETLRTPAVVYFVGAGTSVLLVCILLFNHFESGVNPSVTSLIDSIWWGVATITTVGFGDIVPTTGGGRFVGLVLMGTGVILFVGTTALFMSAFSARVSEEIIEGESLTLSEYRDVMVGLAQVADRLERIEKHLASQPDRLPASRPKD